MEKASFVTFIKAYAWFVLIAVILFLASAFFYSRADEDPKHFDQEISDVLKKLQGTSDPEQRQLMVEELVHAREDYLNHQRSEHLAEALLLAGMMIVTVEGLTRYIASKEVWENSSALSTEIRRQADRVSENVWNAIFQRLVPTQIATEVKKVLKEDICRIRPEYTVTLTRGNYVDIPEGYIVVRRQLYYRLYNLTGGQVENTIPLRVYDPNGDRELTTTTGSKVKLPRICELKVNKVAVPITEAKRVALDHTVKLPKMEAESEALEVFSEVEGLALLNDRALFSQSAPCYDLELSIVNEIPELVKIREDNVYLSTAEDRLYQKTANRWTCEGGLLTGSALSISWRAVPPQAADSKQSASSET
jgi:hypothetical protein